MLLFLIFVIPFLLLIFRYLSSLFSLCFVVASSHRMLRYFFVLLVVHFIIYVILFLCLPPASLYCTVAFLSFASSHCAVSVGQLIFVYFSSWSLFTFPAGLYFPIIFTSLAYPCLRFQLRLLPLCGLGRSADPCSWSWFWSCLLFGCVMTFQQRRRQF